MVLADMLYEWIDERAKDEPNFLDLSVPIVIFDVEEVVIAGRKKWPAT